MMAIAYVLIVFFTVVQSASTKVFNRYSQSSSVFNSIKAISAFCAFVLMSIPIVDFHLPTLTFGALYGVCLCISMYSGYKALCLGPMALTSMIASFSVVVPIIWGFTVGRELITATRLFAIALLLFAIVLTNANKIFKKKRSDGALSGAWVVFTGVTFVFNGVCSTLQKAYKSSYPDAENSEFMMYAMLVCSIVFSFVALSKASLSDIMKTPKKHFGIIAGVSNGLAGFFTLVLAGFENASVLFPMISAGTLLGAMLCGRLVFKERLKANHYVALLAGMAAVVLLNI